MRKFKLIKEYPGSPELGTEVEKELRSSCSYFYRSGDKRISVLNEHVEDNTEYWEEVNKYLWWVVFEEDYDVFESWFPFCLETCTEYKNRFKTKQEAESFILYNKPCLSLTEVQCIIGASDYYDMLIRYIKKNKL
jgi:hypothetical protein